MNLTTQRRPGRRRLATVARSGLLVLRLLVLRLLVLRLLVLGLLVLGLFVAHTSEDALAQGLGGRASAEPTVADLALGWAQGSFASPLICQIDGEPVRGIRRIRVSPGPAHSLPPVARVSFVDLEIETASRCFSALSGDVPNVTGWVQMRLPGRQRPDTAQRDFREAMRRKQGFEYRITSGWLRLQDVSQPPSPTRRVDFRGGQLSLRELPRGSDSAKLLAPFPSKRRLLLELSASDGTRLSFPLYLTDDRG